MRARRPELRRCLPHSGLVSSQKRDRRLIPAVPAPSGWLHEPHPWQYTHHQDGAWPLGPWVLRPRSRLRYLYGPGPVPPASPFPLLPYHRHHTIPRPEKLLSTAFHETPSVFTLFRRSSYPRLFARRLLCFLTAQDAFHRVVSVLGTPSAASELEHNPNGSPRSSSRISEMSWQSHTWTSACANVYHLSSFTVTFAKSSSPSSCRLWESSSSEDVAPTSSSTSV